MSKSRLKLLIWMSLIVAGGLALAYGLSGLSGLLAYFQAGADPASALNLAPDVPLDFAARLSWLPDDEDTGREMEPGTRRQIQAAYLRAWLQWNISYLRREPHGLKTYFAGPALDAIGQAVTQAAVEGWHIEQANLSHLLRLHFYSADGSIVSFTDAAAMTAYVIRDASGAVIYAGESAAAYDVVMFLEDGNWRVRHWLRTGEPDESAAAPPQVSSAAANIVAAEGTSLVLDGAPYLATGVNYYPQAAPWEKFWPNYDPAVTDRDFALIRSLGLNTIRVFIPFEQFGGAQVLAERLDDLDHLLAAAAAHDLKVIVTLFDFRTDYRLLLWPAADRHLETVLRRFAGHPAILAWDLKNEPDRDYGASGRETVDLWLARMARLARAYDPTHLTTIGWSTPDAARRSPAGAGVDIVSFHYYGEARRWRDQYAALRLSVPHRPLLMTEFGLPTWNSFVFPNGHSEAEQAAYYAELLAAARGQDSAGYLAWTLYDYEAAPAAVAGPWPWNTGPQKHLGIVRTDGRLKPAAAWLDPAATPNAAPIPFWARFVKPFWLTTAAGGLAAVAVWRRWRSRRRSLA